MLTRRSLLVTGIGTFGAVAASARAQTPLSEPTYTVRLPDKQKLRVRTAVSVNARGQRVVSVDSLPRATYPAELLMNASVTFGAENKPSRCRVFFGPQPGLGVLLEAVRLAQPGTNGGAAFEVSVPGESGAVPFSGMLFSPLVAELFIGRMYDWAKSGPQTFALILDYGWAPIGLLTLKLTAEANGKPETITLADGPVSARKLRYECALPHLPKDQQTGVFYVGPLGEVLKCDTGFFGTPLLAKGPAYRENSGARIVVPYVNGPGDKAVVFLRGEKKPGGWEVGLDSGIGPRIATLFCDDRFRVTQIESSWRGRPFHGTVENGTFRYRLEPGMAQTSESLSDRVWFVPFWFATELWEGPGGEWAGMAPGDKRTGDYFPLFTGDTGAYPFTLERLPDDEAGLLVVHRYQFRGKNGKNAYDVYTDGTRLIAFLANDGITIMRDGLENYTSTLKAPKTPAPTPPAPLQKEDTL